MLDCAKSDLRKPVVAVSLVGCLHAGQAMPLALLFIVRVHTGWTLKTVFVDIGPLSHFG
jgi:hypothetical protein